MCSVASTPTSALRSGVSSSSRASASILRPAKQLGEIVGQPGIAAIQARPQALEEALTLFRLLLSPLASGGGGSLGVRLKNMGISSARLL